MAETKMTIEQFGQQIKLKYPQYKDVPDAELGNQVIQKYPQYQRVLSPEKPASISPEQAYNEPEKAKKNGLIQAVASPFLKTATTAIGALEGIGRGVAALPGGVNQDELSKINRATTRERDYGFLGSATPVGVSQQQGQQGQSAITQKGGTGQFAKDVIGTGLEVGSYAAPGAIGVGKGVATGLAKGGVQALKPTLGAFARGGAAAGGLGSAGSAIQQEGITPGKAVGQIAGGALLGGLTGAAIPAVGRAVGKAAQTVGKAAGETVKTLPERFINNILRPPSKAFRFGKNPGRVVSELGIIANSEEELAQGISKKIPEIGGQIEQIMGRLDQSPKIEVNKIFAPLDEAITKAQKFKRTNQPLITRLESLRDDLKEIVGGKVEKITPQQAFEIKKQIGQVSKWTGQAFDAELNQARVGVYSNLKKAIEREAGLLTADGKGLRKLNEIYGNLIEAQSAIENRIGVSQRNNMISLPDIGALSVGATLSGGPGAIGLFLLKRAVGTVTFKTRAAAILAKLTQEQKQVLDEIMPSLAPLIEEMPKGEIGKFIDALPSLTTLIRNGVIQIQNNAVNPEK